MASGDLITQIADERTAQKILNEVLKISASVLDASTFDFKAFFEARATGEVFTTRFYTYETSTSPAGEKLNASTGLRAVPSTETEQNVDDFAARNAFSYVDCNFICNENGKRIPSAIAGQAGFSYYGAKDVGILTPPTYWGIEDHGSYYDVHFSDKRHPEINCDTPTPWCLDDFGKEMGYGIVTKYYAGYVDGVLYSSSGIAPAGFISYSTGHTNMQRKGTGYNGSGAARTAYLLCMLWIKYATKNSQTVFKGCNTFNIQKFAATAESGVKHITLTTADAVNFYVGACVCLGELGDASAPTNRNDAAAYNIANRVLVSGIEAVDDTYTRIYVDVEDSFNTTTTTLISSMPCLSGTTDNILGADGYQSDDAKHAFKLNGVEDGIGAYYISLDEVWEKDTATKTSYYVRKGAAWSGSASGYTKVAEFDKDDYSDSWLGDIAIDLETGVVYPKTYGSGWSLGVGDMHYYGGDKTGQRVALRHGCLWNGWGAGLCTSTLLNTLSFAEWIAAVCV